METCGTPYVIKLLFDSTSTSHLLLPNTGRYLSL